MISKHTYSAHEKKNLTVIITSGRLGEWKSHLKLKIGLVLFNSIKIIKWWNLIHL